MTKEVIAIKKVLGIMLVFICLLGLSGCDPKMNQLSKAEASTVVKIELVDYKNDHPELLTISGEEKPRFDYGKATLIATLDESRFGALIEEVTEMYYTDYGTALNEPMGKTLVVHLNNGSMIVWFGCVYTNENNKTFYYGDCYVFAQNGEFIRYIGDVGYNFPDTVESKYFQSAP